MRTIRQKKLIYIGILVFTIGIITVGFAMFSSTLNIKSSTTVTADPDSFSVSLSSASDSIKTGRLTAHTATGTGSTPTAYTATISNDGKTITNLGAAFTDPGQTVEYYIFVKNNGKMPAKIKRYGWDEDGNNMRVCTAGSGTTNSLVQAACEDIKIKIQLYHDPWLTGSVTYPKTGKNETTTFSSSFILQATTSDYLRVSLTMIYDSAGARADGPFTVEFTDLNFEFSTN